MFTIALAKDLDFQYLPMSIAEYSRANYTIPHNIIFPLGTFRLYITDVICSGLLICHLTHRNLPKLLGVSVLPHLMPEDKVWCTEARAEEPEEVERETGSVVDVEGQVLENHKLMIRLNSGVRWVS